jgi:competence ComEA-like helix-hairpin-helix protein
MEKIPLRTYLKETENLVDRGETDQAIAHCRHILKSYPKNLATYRLLGKAFLESRRYGDAADVFQRVLSGVPDDFVSHVGMSIIREDEGNQDAAIWHMERAFEIQPYNSAIQDELRRLYGRRDGLEPPKVRLTRGALARMYARGNLYQQAIGELRAALAEDPQRSDLQVMLARMYFMAGQKVEAVETCSNLLKKLPYCLEANRVISAILPETERKEETQVYRERVMALDPYLVLASPFETTADNVRDQVVVIEKLDYKEGQLEEASQPAWAASLGVTFDDLRSSEEPTPDWLQAISQDQTPAKKRGPGGPLPEQARREEASFEDASGEAASLPSAGEEGEELPSWISFPDQPTGAGEEKSTEIPDWMKDAGWEASSGAGEGTLPPFEYPEEGEADLSEITKAELPPWLQALAPEGLETPTGSSGEEASKEFMPWLQESGAAGKPPTPETESDWLEDLAEQPTETPTAVPDWLSELAEAGQEGTQTEPSEEIPEWLKETEGILGETPAEGEDTSAAEQEVRLELPVSEAEPAEEMPDWLKEIEGAPQEQAHIEEEAAEAPETEPSIPVEEVELAEEIPDWLKEPEAELEEQTATEEEPLAEVETAEGAPSEETPDWLEQIEAEPEELAVAEEELAAEVHATEEALLAEEAPTEETPEWLEEIEAEPEEMAVAEEELVAETPATEEALLAEEAPAEEMPDWLEEIEAEPEEMAVAEEELAAETPATEEALLEEEAPAEETPDWLEEIEAEPEEMAVAVGEPVTDVEGLEEAPAQEETPLEEVPEWLQELEGEPQVQPAAEEMPAALSEVEGEAPSAEEMPEEEIPAWLKELGVSPLATELDDEEGEGADLSPQLAEAAQFDEVPDWLKGFEESTPAPAFDEVEGSTETIDEAESAEEIPDWIKEMGAGQLQQVESQLDDRSAAGADSAETESEEIEELDWLQIIGEEPMGAETAFTLEDEATQEMGQDDYSSAELEALLADTQPVHLGEEAKVVPFNEILEEIDAEMEDEGQAEEIEEVSFEQFEGTSLAEIESPIEETLSKDIEQIAEDAGALEAEEAGQAVVEETEPPLEEKEDLDVLLEGLETPVAEEEATFSETSLEAAAEMPTFDLEDQDASLAWLESLAAKHGVAEEELFTRPEERPAETPSWIAQELTEAGDAVEQVEPETPDELEAEIEFPDELAEASDLEQIVSAIQEEEDVFTLPEWSEEKTATEEPVTEGELPEEKPDWLKALQAEDLEEPFALPADETEAQVEPPEAEAEEIAEAELPDWLRAVQEEADQELAQTQVEQEIEAPAALDDTDAAMAWLESLAAKQGVPEEELFTAPEQRAETPPEWVEETVEAGIELPVQETPLEDQPVEAPPQDEALQEPLADDREMVEARPESLAAEAEGEPAAEIEERAQAQAEVPSQEEPALPEWLAETEAEEIQEEEWTPPVEPVKAALREPRHGTAPLTQPPAEPLDINKASLVDLEVLPGVGFILAQNILTYREAFGHYASIDDLIKVPGINPSILAEIREYLMVSEIAKAPPPVEPEMLAEAQSELIIARNRLAEGDVEETVIQYSKLIKNRELLPEVIRDLKEALYRFPVDISLWQTLGDAYMRSDQLTEALDAYTKAEELLR